MIIAFIGCDGSGKTTISKKVMERLKRKEIWVKYKHQYNTFISNLLGGWARKKYRSDERKVAKKEKNKTYYKLWPFLMWLNLLCELLFIKIFCKDKMCIFDRYFYDMKISWEIKDLLNYFSRNLFKLLPKPDLTFLCDAKPRTLYKRRKEEYKNLKECELKREKYLKLAKKKINIVNTERNPKKVEDEIFHKIKHEL